MLEKTFYKDRKFDIISSQFVIHYLFGSQNSIDNLIKNVKTFLNKDGYVLLTLFDSDLVNKLFENENKYTSYYTNEDGKREKLYEIVKKYKTFLDFILVIPLMFIWVGLTTRTNILKNF